MNYKDLEFGLIDKDSSRIIFADIMSIDKARLGRKIGKLSALKMEQLDSLLKKHLSLQ